MYSPTEVVEVFAWGKRVGAVSLDPFSGLYVFQYNQNWLRSGVELSPFSLPIARGKRSFAFPSLPKETFKQLPPMLADSLPDKFGNALIDAALSDMGIPKENVTPLDRLAYMSDRSMGALEFRPPASKAPAEATAIKLSLLVEAARLSLEGGFGSEGHSASTIKSIIQVGTSAGGARAKAVIAFNRETGEVRSGHAPLGRGFDHWLIKLDGVQAGELGDGSHYGRVEYAYHLMAVAANLTMMPCLLIEESGRAHFMTKRFDRDGATKHHIQTLCAMRHLDFNAIGVHSYNQYFDAIDGLGLSEEERQEAFRRMVFNVMASNCDDHTKNFSFMLRRPEGFDGKTPGKWALTPAYDLTFAHNPNNPWTKQHLMSVNGKFAGIERADLLSVADRFLVVDARKIIEEVEAAVARWDEFASIAGVPQAVTERISKNLVLVGKERKWGPS